jgi:hypothetical protein
VIASLKCTGKEKKKKLFHENGVKIKNTTRSGVEL